MPLTVAFVVVTVSMVTIPVICTMVVIMVTMETGLVMVAVDIVVTLTMFPLRAQETRFSLQQNTSFKFTKNHYEHFMIIIVQFTPKQTIITFHHHNNASNKDYCKQDGVNIYLFYIRMQITFLWYLEKNQNKLKILLLFQLIFTIFWATSEPHK